MINGPRGPDMAIVRNGCSDIDGIHGTTCYGAPFAGCDIRRDQVGFLVSALTVLTDVEWSDHCTNVIRIKSSDHTDGAHWGFAFEPSANTTSPGASASTWVTDVYGSYASKLHNIPGVRSNNSMVFLLGKLIDLEQRFVWYNTDWRYESFAIEVNEKLSDLTLIPMRG